MDSETTTTNAASADSMMSEALSLSFSSFPSSSGAILVPPPTPNLQQQPQNEQTSTMPVFSVKPTVNDTSTLLLTTANASVGGQDCEWNNSLFRPASRFSIKRRECKSTSDESFTFDLNTAHRANGANTQAASGRGEDFLLTSISSLHTGKFGFNPTMRRLSSLTGIISPATAVSLVSTASGHATSSGSGCVKKNHSFSAYGNASGGAGGSGGGGGGSAALKSTRDKKNVKRLSATNRFYIDSHSKKSQEKKDCKKRRKIRVNFFVILLYVFLSNKGIPVFFIKIK